MRDRIRRPVATLRLHDDSTRPDGHGTGRGVSMGCQQTVADWLQAPDWLGRRGWQSMRWHAKESSVAQTNATLLKRLLSLCRYPGETRLRDRLAIAVAGHIRIGFVTRPPIRKCCHTAGQKPCEDGGDFCRKPANRMARIVVQRLPQPIRVEPVYKGKPYVVG
jgi:hypothetical protein